MPKPKSNSKSLAEWLSGLKKDELTDLRMALGVKGVSQLNKSELAERLSGEVVDKLAYILSRMDSERFRVLQSVMKAPNGVVPAHKMDDNYDSFYFQLYGLLFMEEHHVFMPQEITDAMRELDLLAIKGNFRRNERWANLTRGMLFYYGYLSNEQLLELVGKLTGEPVDRVAFFHVVYDLMIYDYSLKYDDEGVWHYMIEDPSELIEDQNMRKSVAYHLFPEAELIKAAEHDYVDRHAGYKALLAVLRKHWRVDKGSADEMAGHVTFAIQQGASLSDLVSDLLEELEVGSEAQMRDLADALTLFNNQTRMWVLKGNAPDEVSALRNQLGQQPMAKAPGKDRRAPIVAPLAAASASVLPFAAPASKSTAEVYSFETMQKVGRNEPCPCGSGKKYKKCCGGNA
ncbi:MAG: hypothetical protein K0Q63_417 [Paenibacillus sp.]|nr:hypothetical protein [Paenibacillus sp.]